MKRTSSNIRIQIVDTEKALWELADAWERLQANARVTSVFETFDWQALWWRYYGRGQRLRVLLALDGDDIVGILPLYVHRLRRLKYPVRALRFIGSGGDTFPDDLGPIIAASRELEVADALARAVVESRGWDVLLLTDMQSDHPFAEALERRLRSTKLRVETGRSERIAHLTLPKTWDGWLASLHRDRRYRIRNARKKLRSAHPDARFFVWTDEATLPEGVDRLAHLHRKRWQRAGQPHAFATPRYLGFHRDVMAACLRRDRLRLYCLEIGGEIVASYYFYRFRNQVFLMQSGFDPDHAAVKPGNVLLGHVIEHAVGEGNEAVDFLRGDHRYKDELATGERETVFVTTFRRNPGALMYRARHQYLPTIKATVLRTLRRFGYEAPRRNA